MPARILKIPLVCSYYVFLHSYGCLFQMLFIITKQSPTIIKRAFGITIAITAVAGGAVATTSLIQSGAMASDLNTAIEQSAAALSYLYSLQITKKTLEAAGEIKTQHSVLNLIMCGKGSVSKKPSHLPGTDPGPTARGLTNRPIAQLSATCRGPRWVSCPPYGETPCSPCSALMQWGRAQSCFALSTGFVDSHGRP